MVDKKKSKVVTYSKLTKHFFHVGTRTWFSNQAFKFLRIVTGIAIVNDVACYSYVKKYGVKLQISLGKKFFTEVIDNKKMTDEIMVKDLKTTYKRMSVIFKGVFFHEIAHHLYTDMSQFTDMMRVFKTKSAVDIAMLFKSVMNIVEDVVIEEEFSFYKPLIGKTLKYLRSNLFTVAKINEVEEAIEDAASDDFNTFMNYILIRYRVPSRVSFEHPLYTKHKKDIHSGMYVCLKTNNPSLRIKRLLAYAYELYKLLVKGEEFDIKEVIKGKDIAWIKSLPDMSKIAPVISAPSISSPLDADEDTPGGASVSKPHMKSSPSIQAESDDKDSVDSIKDEDLHGGKESSLGVPPSPISGGDDSTVDDGLEDVDPEMKANQDIVIRNAANDSLMINFDHRAMYCNDYFINSTYESQYLAIVAEYDNEIKRMVSVVKKILATNNNRYARHQTRGKLDKRKISKRIINNKLFKNKVAPKPVADLAMSFLIDNSGSMAWGRKTRITGRALIILQETCYRLGIPYEVNAFTEADGCAITIEMKRFEDKHKDCKNNAIIISHEINVPVLHTFEGNVDEANLDFVGKRFLANRKEKDKILIYMADGATCGGSESLKLIGEQLVAQGISVLAIGIVDQNVKKSFPDNHIIFDTIDDLEKLAPTLQRYIFSKIFKGE